MERISKWLASKRAKIRVTSFLSVLIIILAVIAYIGVTQSNYYKNQLEHTYQRALSELTEYMNNIQLNLNKSIYAGTSAQISNLSNKIYEEAGGAKSNLSQLPVSDLELDNVYKYLSQVGDFSNSINNKIARGEEMTDSDRENFETLWQLSETIVASINKAQESLDSGTLKFGEVKQTLLVNEELDDTVVLSDSLQDTEDTLTNYPILIYDGPFSDHVLQTTPQLTEGKDDAGRDAAKATASKYTGIALKDISDDTDGDGRIPYYGFASGDVYMAVTKNGGYMLNFYNSRFADKVVLSEEEGLERAKEYLSNMGIENMRGSYYSITNGVMTVNFAYTENGVVYYTDLIMVGVAMDNGEIVSYNATGYVMNHKERDLGVAALSEAQAKRQLSGNLEVKSARMALIPTSGGSEKYCYEFHCIGKYGDELLVYINTGNGAEESILMLLYMDNGVLTK